MEIEARHVRRRQLGQYLDKELLNRERKNNEPTLSSLLTSNKRLSNELMSTTPKRSRLSESVCLSCFFLHLAHLLMFNLLC